MRTQGYSSWRGSVAAMLLCALFALALPAGAAAENDAQASIIGGRSASIAEFPSLAYIEAQSKRESFACTGSVVAPRVILTAAHCVESIENGGITSPAAYRVATGVTTPKRATRQNVSRVSETHIFPGFDPGAIHGDAAILVLSTPTTAPPLALAGPADAALYEGGAVVQLAGWGVTRGTAANGAESLRSASTVVQKPSFCKRKTRSYYGLFSPASQLCTVDPPAKKTGGCFGDSGGPAIAHRADGTPIALGIVSVVGPFCDPRLPNVTTRVDYVSSWVSGWIAAVETGAPPPAVDPTTPFPTMSKITAETFTVYTLANAFGNRFIRADQVLGSCRRTSRSRFKCEVLWRTRPNIYAGTVSPFYVRRQGTVTWDSHFRIEWAGIRCLRDRASRCPVRSKRG